MTPQATPARTRAIQPAHIARQAAQVGRQYAFECDTTCNHPPLTGTTGMVPLADGLLLRHADVCNCSDISSRNTLAAGIKLILVLDGEVDVRFGGHRLPARRAGEAALVNLFGNTVFERRGHAGTRETSLTLTVPHGWLCCHLDAVPPDNAAHADTPRPDIREWQPDAFVLQQARHVLGLAGHTPSAIFRLHCDGLARTMLADALPLLCPDMPTHVQLPRANDMRGMGRVRDLLGQADIGHLTLDQIAEKAGMSRSSLQRHFRHSYGISLRRHIRQLCLHRARRQLRQSHLGIAAIAAAVGYDNPANFATAFKRQFGMTPSQYRHQRSD